MHFQWTCTQAHWERDRALLPANAHPHRKGHSLICDIMHQAPLHFTLTHLKLRNAAAALTQMTWMDQWFRCL